MADELPEVGAFNQQPTLADIGKSSAATSLGSIGSLINLASRNLDPNAEQMFRELSGSDSVETDLPDIESFKEMFGAPESLNIGDFVGIEPFSKVLAGGKAILAGSKGIIAMLPYITASGVNVTKLLETIRKIKDRAISTRNSARSSENPKLKEAEYKEADKLDLEAKKLESQITPEDIINEQKHRAAQSTEEGAEKGLAEIRKSLGIVPKKKQFKELASKGQIHQARTNKESIKTIKNKETPAQDFNIQEMSDDVGLDYEAGDFTKQFEDAGLHVIDDNMGRVIVGRTKKDAMNLLNAKTPIEYGKAYGYSDADIAQFYITRSGGNIDYGYKEFTKDLLDTYK